MNITFLECPIEINYTKDLKDELKRLILDAVPKDEQDVVFYYGGKSDFDLFAYRTVTELSADRPDFKTVSVVPFPETDNDVHRYDIGDVDKKIYPSFEYGSVVPGCDLCRQYVIDKADVVICCIRDDTYYKSQELYRYARSLNKKILILIPHFRYI